MGVSKYSEEFKAQAVAMVVEKKHTPQQVGADLGATDKTIRRLGQAAFKQPKLEC